MATLSQGILKKEVFSMYLVRGKFPILAVTSPVNLWEELEESLLLCLAWPFLPEVGVSVRHHCHCSLS